MEPFIIAVEGVCESGEDVLIFVGVEVACDIEEAFCQAVTRWPFFDIVPIAWEKVSPQARLAALEADRQESDDAFQLNVGILL